MINKKTYAVTFILRV